MSSKIRDDHAQNLNRRPAVLKADHYVIFKVAAHPQLTEDHLLILQGATSLAARSRREGLA